MLTVIDFILKITLYLPTIIIIIGITISIINFRNNKLISLLTFVALLIQLLIILTTSYINEWISNSLLSDNALPILPIYIPEGIFSLRSLFSAVSWILIILAVFIFRRNK
jgi:hypothetical protein